MRANWSYRGLFLAITMGVALSLAGLLGVGVGPVYAATGCGELTYTEYCVDGKGCAGWGCVGGSCTVHSCAYAPPNCWRTCTCTCPGGTGGGLEPLPEDGG